MSKEKCGCTVTTVSGKTVRCEQPVASDEHECYYHNKVIRGLCSPSKSGDVDVTIDGGRWGKHEDDVESIENKFGQKRTFI